MQNDVPWKDLPQLSMRGTDGGLHAGLCRVKLTTERLTPSWHAGSRIQRATTAKFISTARELPAVFQRHTNARPIPVRYSINP